MERIYRGMVLAAGLGKRLAPLTDVLPKPLLLLGPERLIESAIRRLTTAGIDEIAVNLHHLGDQIREALGDGERLSCRLRYFDEPQLLGTAGALRNASSFLGQGPFVVVNSDVVADIELSPALRTHEASGAAATLVVRAQDGAGHSSLLIDSQNRVRDVAGLLRVPPSGLREVHFAGIAVYEPQLLEPIPPGVAETPRDLWAPLLRDRNHGGLAAHCVDGYFSDVGTWTRLLTAHMERLRPSHRSLPHDIRVHEPVHIDASVVLEGPVEIGPAVTLGAGAFVRGPARLADLIVLPGERLGPGFFRRGVVGAGLFLQPPTGR
jgi:NDP-sugar pyrophosphorylase family protein